MKYVQRLYCINQIKQQKKWILWHFKALLSSE